MEQLLVRWMARIIGFPPEAGGNLSSGGSLANLSGIVTAREAHGIEAAQIPNTVIYASPHMHHCLDKAIRIGGLQECIRRDIPLDDHYRMRSDLLREKLEADREAGLTPWLVIASAGTTDTGAVDPLPEIADLAKDHELWFHCDAAYGGFFTMTEEGKERLQGIERADSVVLDPHKGLFLPYGSGALLVRDRNLLHQAFTYEANYMKDAEDPDGILSPAEISPELTKHFRGLRMWLPLKVHGVEPFRDCSLEKLQLARYFHEVAKEIPGIEVGPEPDLSIVIFRVKQEGIDPNEATERLNTRLREEGRVFFSSTTLDGEVWLRAAILSFRTHKDTVDLGLERIRAHTEEVIGELQGENSS
jgi:aromatic-L-amino-acid decarboxylase